MNIIYNGQKDTRLYKNALPEIIDKLISEDEKVCWLDADLSGCSGTKANFDKTDRYINCGIAEANMAGIAAGLSATGMKPYAHSFAPFASRRCFDQVFMSAAYANNPITMIGTDPGITAAFNGGTHMPFEDTGIYRTIPNAVICDCTDVPMLESFLTQASCANGVKYIRVGRKESYQVYEDGSHFTFGKGNIIKEGSDCLIVASGIMVHEAMQAATQLEKDGINCCVVDPFTIKPLDVELIQKCAKICQNRVVVAENHNKIGGLVSAVTEALVEIPCKFKYVAIEDTFGEVGPQDYLREKYDLTDKHICRCVKEII